MKLDHCNSLSTQFRNLWSRMDLLKTFGTCGYVRTRLAVVKADSMKVVF